MFPNTKIVEAIRKEYPAGTRVRLLKMDDVQAPPIGTEGTVVGVDDIGSLLMRWDNGSSFKDFRQYARCMMYPDPTGIDMSEELDDLVTNAINEGKTTLHAAFDKLVKRDTNGRIDYSYSDGFDGFVYGQELLCFCDVKTAIERLELR